MCISVREEIFELSKVVYVQDFKETLQKRWQDPYLKKTENVCTWPHLE